MAESQETTIALLQKDIKNIFDELKGINEKLDHTYATKEELEAVEKKADFTQKIVFTFIGLIVLAVIGAWIASVVLPRVGAQSSTVIHNSN